MTAPSWSFEIAQTSFELTVLLALEKLGLFITKDFVIVLFSGLAWVPKSKCCEPWPRQSWLMVSLPQLLVTVTAGGGLSSGVGSTSAATPRDARTVGQPWISEILQPSPPSLLLRGALTTQSQQGQGSRVVFGQIKSQPRGPCRWPEDSTSTDKKPATATSIQEQFKIAR